MAVSPSIVSGRVVATMIFSSTPVMHISTGIPWYKNLPNPSSLLRMQTT